MTGDSAAQILQALANADGGHQSRQYGIVSLTGGEETFTGTGAGAWAGGVVGQSGNLRYAIQGNILTGQPVVTAAEQALVTTPGGLPDKLMAAMEAARAMGGDGRCSCSQFSPTACGSLGATPWSRGSSVRRAQRNAPAPSAGMVNSQGNTYWHGAR